MEEWSPKQVSQLIGGLGKADCWKQYSKVVLDEDLDGLTFVNISQDSLTKLGFRPLHAEAIVKQRDKLQASPALLASFSTTSPPPPPPAYSVSDSGDSDGSDGKSQTRCSLHNRPFEVFCVQDQQLACVTCMTTYHRGHVCDSVNDVFAREKGNIERLLNEATQRGKTWTKSAEAITNMRKQAQANSDRVFAEIENFFLAVENRLRERKEALQVEVKRAMEEKVRMLTKQEEEIRGAVKGLEKVGGSVKQCLGTKSAVECLQLRKDIIILLGNKKNQQQRQQQGGRGGIRCEPDCGVDMQFFGDLKPIRGMIDGLGELYDEDSAVASQCEARKLKVITRPPQFLPQYCGQHLNLSQNNTMVTKTCGGHLYNAAVLGDNGNNNQGVLSYTIKLLSGSATMVGFASKAINKDDENHHTCGFYLYTASGGLYSQRGDYSAWLGRPCNAAGTVIQCVLDTVKREIWFGVNGDKLRLAHQNVPPDVTHLALNLAHQGSSVQLLDS